MTVYKAIEHEADAAADLAIALARVRSRRRRPCPSTTAPTTSERARDAGCRDEDNIAKYFGNPDYPKKSDICAGKLAAKCTALGL